MRNIKSIIDGHNKAILNHTTREDKCNCRRPENCPLDGKCTASSVIYQATVTRDDNRAIQTYVGLTEGKFKLRYSNHISSFSYAHKKSSTELSKYIWSLKVIWIFVITC
jgi:hypothetical protein